ncbi:hypothetical protein [Anaerobacterium chartisolvens]|nr:hypothetical protein [Anaerobacterium chartisolvens]
MDIKCELTKCCEIVLRLLTQLKDEGKISQEEYNRHIGLKIKFLE